MGLGEGRIAESLVGMRLGRGLVSANGEATLQNIPQGLKPAFSWGSFSARLKSCPDTKPDRAWIALLRWLAAERMLCCDAWETRFAADHAWCVTG